MWPLNVKAAMLASFCSALEKAPDWSAGSAVAEALAADFAALVDRGQPFADGTYFSNNLGYEWSPSERLAFAAAIKSALAEIGALIFTNQEGACHGE
jgi:hypothetical protein